MPKRAIKSTTAVPLSESAAFKTLIIQCLLTHHTHKLTSIREPFFHKLSASKSVCLRYLGRGGAWKAAASVLAEAADWLLAAMAPPPLL